MSRDYNIAWEVTGGCNQNCFYCYNFWRKDAGAAAPSAGTEADYERVTDELLRLRPLSVALTGGEPLLVFDRLRKCIPRLAEQGIFLRLLTNGSLVTEEIAEFLARHRVQVMVSFPAVGKERFSTITNADHYDAVVRGLELLKKHGVDVLVNVVVSKPNLDSMEQTADFLVDRYGFSTLYFSRATAPHNAPEELGQLLDNRALQCFFENCLKIRKRLKIQIKTCGGYAYCAIRNRKALSLFAKGCGGGKSSFVISNDGNVRVCGKDSQVFGNIFLADADEIMDRAAFWTEPSAIPKACDSCRYRLQCRGGCHMSALEQPPRYNSLDCNAEPALGPLRLPGRRRFVFLNPLRRYRLSDTARYCETERGHRFSNAFVFLYLPEELAVLLRSGASISLFTVVRRSGCTFRESKRLFSELLRKKILRHL